MLTIDRILNFLVRWPDARPPGAPSPARRGLFSWIWRYSRPQQITILLMIAASLPFYFLSLDLPKQIINGPLQGQGFATPDATRLFPSAPTWLPKLALDRWETLVALSLCFVALVVINGVFKLTINTAKGKLGEQMLRRLRLELVDSVLARPPHQPMTAKGSEIASIVKDEVEPLGGFIGDAFVVPALLIAQAATATVFILAQNIWLGLVALAIVGLQAWLVPRLRRRLIALGRQRQLNARTLAGRVGELVDGIRDVHINDAARQERNAIDRQLAKIYENRFEIYQRKFAIKFVNNSLAQVPPLIFYLIGGALVLRGALDVGQLVAVIVAYKELPGPIKELIDWDQQRQDVVAQFDQIVEQLPLADAAPGEPAPTTGEIQITQTRDVLPLRVAELAVETPDHGDRLEDLSLGIAPGDRIAAVGDGGSGASALALVLSGLAVPQSGAVHSPRGEPVDPRRMLGHKIAFVGDEHYIAQTSLAGALAFGRDVSDHDLFRVLELVDLEEEVLEFSLRQRISAAERADLAEGVLAARQRLQAELADGAGGRLITPFDPNQYNTELPIGDNLVFGQLEGDAGRQLLFGGSDSAAVLRPLGLQAALAGIGRTMASTAVELYGDLRPDHPFLQSQRLVAVEDLPRVRRLLAGDRDGDGGTSETSEDLALIALGYVEPRHRLGLLTADVRALVLRARQNLRPLLASSPIRGVDALDTSRYCDTLTVEQNLLFGTPVTSVPDGARRLRAAVRRALQATGGMDRLLRLGLEFDTGPAGRRLSTAQRQKIALARALLREPDLLVVDRALSVLGAAQREALVRRIIERLRANDPPTAVYWVLAGEGGVSAFDRILMFEGGRIVDDRAADTRGPERQSPEERPAKAVAARGGRG